MVIALVQAQLISTCKTLTVLVEATHNLMSADLIIVMLLLVIFLVSATAAIAVVKASLEEDESSEPKVRLDVKDDEGEVSLNVIETEVKLMCRDFLVRHSLSVEQGLVELEGRVADLGVKKTNEGLFVIHSKMI